MFDSSHTLLLALSVGSVLCNLVSYGVYICQQAQEKVRPEPVGWLVSFTVLTVNCVSQWSMGGTWWSMATVAAQAVGSLIIMGMCFLQGVWQLSKVDVLALVIAFVALFCAQILDAPALGIVLTLVADGSGRCLMIRKAARVPGADRILAWAINLGAGPPAIAAAMLTGGGMLLLSPAYLLVVDGVMVAAIRSKRWKGDDELEVRLSGAIAPTTA